MILLPLIMDTLLWIRCCRYKPKPRNSPLLPPLDGILGAPQLEFCWPEAFPCIAVSSLQGCFPHCSLCFCYPAAADAFRSVKMKFLLPPRADRGVQISKFAGPLLHVEVEDPLIVVFKNKLPATDASFKLSGGFILTSDANPTDPVSPGSTVRSAAFCDFNCILFSIIMIIM